MNPPATEITAILRNCRPGRALDLACGSGRHARWLVENGWVVSAVDIAPDPIPGVECIHADLERHEFEIAANAWDLIVCWLYWQEDLLPEIAAGVKPGGIACLAGKTTGRFATSLDRYRAGFRGWEELHASDDGNRCVYIGRKPGGNHATDSSSG